MVIFTLAAASPVGLIILPRIAEEVSAAMEDVDRLTATIIALAILDILSLFISCYSHTNLKENSCIFNLQLF
jgi:hypothetical protein